MNLTGTTPNSSLYARAGALGKKDFTSVTLHITPELAEQKEILG